MMVPLFSAALVGLAYGSPLVRRQSTDPNDYPPYTYAKAFSLVANVTDLSQKFVENVHGWYLTGIHAGAGIDAATLVPSLGEGGGGGGGAMFQNGTALEVAMAQGSIIADAGWSPMSLHIGQVIDSPFQYGIGISIGAVQKEVGITTLPRPTPKLYWSKQGTFVACDDVFGAPGQPRIAVRFSESTYNETTGEWEHHVPSNCIAITLLPECGELIKLPDSAGYTHEFAQEVRCYGKVSAIDWTRWNVPWKLLV
jgi:hypothetical protein